jgi:hypothetical protein
MGVLEQINTQQTDMTSEITELYQKLGDRDNLTLLRGVLEKLN